MKIFISWSGHRSRDVAEELREWLPNVIQSAEPFISSEDIDAGRSWFTEIKSELDQCSFGIICLTKSNREAPWLLYEAGALAHKVERANLIPLMIDLTPSDFGTPLSLFQGCSLDKESFFRVVRAINDRADGGLSETRLVRSFETWWPQLDNRLQEVSANTYPDENVLEEVPETDRSSEPKIEHAVDEILSRVRTIGVGLDEIRSHIAFSSRSSQLSEYLAGTPNNKAVKASQIAKWGLENELFPKGYGIGDEKSLSNILKSELYEQAKHERLKKRRGQNVDPDDDNNEEQ